MQNNRQTAIQIRRAKEEDCEQLLVLIKDLALFERAPEEVTVSLEHFKQSGFGKQPVWWAFVAECAGEVCAFALYYVRYSTWKGQRLYLEDIYVTPAMRGKGIATQLMHQLIEEGKQRKLNGMVWQALEWNQEALDFYKKFNSRFDAAWVNCSIEQF